MSCGEDSHYIIRHYWDWCLKKTTSEILNQTEVWGKIFLMKLHKVVFQSLRDVQLLWPHGPAARQGSLSWSLFKFISIESMIPSNHLILCHPLLPKSSVFPRIRSFPVSWLFASGGQNVGASVSTSVLPLNIQGLFPLGLAGLISLLSKDSQESSPGPQFKSINDLCFLNVEF